MVRLRERVVSPARVADGAMLGMRRATAGTNLVAVCGLRLIRREVGPIVAGQ